MQGTLRDFRLAEILQLVAVQQKTGLLRVQDHAALLTFYFESGVLVSCRDRRRISDDPLLDYMQRSGWLDLSTAQRYATESNENRIDVVDLLLERHVVTSDEVEVLLDDLAQDLIYQTFSWSDGAYRFIAGEEALRGLKYTISRQVEGLLIEAARRKDEWPELLKKVPGPDSLVERTGVPPDAADANMLALLNRITAPMRVCELVAQARISEYYVYEALAAALEANLVTVTATHLPSSEPSGDEPRGAAKTLRRRRATIELSTPLAWGAALGITLSFLAGGYVISRHTAHTSQPRARKLEMETAGIALRHQLEVFRALHGCYPSTLEALTEYTRADAKLLHRARVSSYSTDKQGRTYKLDLEQP